jgi:S1-C subfamily serine protease
METPSAPPISIPVPKPRTTKRFSGAVIIALLLVGLVAGGLVGYAVSYLDFNGKLDGIQAQLQNYSQNAIYGNSTATYVIQSNVSLSNLYQQVKSAVIVVQDIVPNYGLFGGLIGYSLQQGSGFVTKVNEQMVVVTNYHVIEDAINETVTFADGTSFSATVLGSDPRADLAVLSVSSIPNDVTPLTLVSSLSLQVGDPVVAVGSPYGLAGTLTTGVISALGRTIIEDSGSSQGSGQTIPDMIQTSTAINSGNSGGPLIDYAGHVVGITTAAVSNSQGLGFAIPSATVMRELSSLITTGSYDEHPSIGATGTDMNYQIAQAMGTSVTYGWLVESVSTQTGLKGGTTQVSVLGSRVIIGGDIIIAINGSRITNTDDLLCYLERNTLPGQTASFTVVRNGQTQTASVNIEKL